MVNAQQCLVDGACRVALRQGDVLAEYLGDSVTKEEMQVRTDSRYTLVGGDQ